MILQDNNLYVNILKFFRQEKNYVYFYANLDLAASVRVQ